MKRYSSLRGELFSSLLEKNLAGAKSYDRIAGYFSSSILEIAGEAIESMEGKVRIVCNSDLDIEDVKTAKLASEALRREWCEFKPEDLPPNSLRFKRLYDFIKSGKLEIRILPKDKFGLEHGKAGVFTRADGSKTSFIGSVNESYNGWKINYELVWEDDSPETVAWVEEEFEMLWNNPSAVELCDFVIEDINRIATRQVIETVDEWNDNNSEASSVFVESDINRKGFGLWEHQKYFIDKVFKDHKTIYGARYILADEVGLGKTLQLAVSAELMALYGQKPVLIIVPKTLLFQWQNELKDLLDLPSAVWDGKAWLDDDGISYPLPINKCPRKIGIISQGIINNGSDSCKELKEKLLGQSYECVVVDESHRARRRNLSENKLNKSPEMNNLYSFLMSISVRTHSMLLATATPVQLYKIEAFDLLNILSQANGSVLGDGASYWRKPNNNILRGLDLITGENEVMDITDAWHWMCNPLPPADENPHLKAIRVSASMNDDNFHCHQLVSDFSKPVQKRIEKLISDGFFMNCNPYIRHIIRRERSYLENTINPVTNQPYLPKIEVELLGEGSSDSIVLNGYLGAAYQQAELFCELIQKRCSSAGLFKTLLLRRIGSSMIAGYNTGIKMLNEWGTGCTALNVLKAVLEYDEASDNEETKQVISNELKNLTKEEYKVLNLFVENLSQVNVSSRQDPKYNKVLNLLDNGALLKDGSYTVPWKNLGCILFSQYFDTVDWIAKNLSEDIDFEIGVYAGGGKSGIYNKGNWRYETRDNIKALVKQHKLKILVGTDAASEGLNLQTLGTLINLDLPWNPTRLEQRKGRIQRIGQVNDTVYVYNLRYRGSVEDRVHELLSERMESIYKMFGQIPDVLEDVWIDVAVGNIEEAKKRINSMPLKHPFAVKYHDNITPVDWESCASVLNKKDIKRKMLEQW